ncbi:unnamed protein product, partial [Ectocarpus fasciculatus]
TLCRTTWSLSCSRLRTTSREASFRSSGCTLGPSRPRFPCTTPREEQRNGRSRSSGSRPTTCGWSTPYP